MPVQMIFAPPPAPGIIAASGCPHYITAAFAERTGQTEMCAGCATRPIVLYGQYGKSGPTRRQRTTKSDPAGKGHTRRRAA